MIKFKIIVLFFISTFYFAQSHKIIESTSDHLTISIDFTSAYSISDTIIDNRKLQKIISSQAILRHPGEPLIPIYSLNIGLPPNKSASVKIHSSAQKNYNNILLMPYVNDSMEKELSERKIIFSEKIYNVNRNFPTQIAEISDRISMRFANYSNLVISPYQFNPVTRKLIFYENLTLTVDFIQSNIPTEQFISKNDHITSNFINSTFINHKDAVHWQGIHNLTESSKSVDEYWYSPNKEYFKIFVDSLDLYRVSYGELVSAGLTANNIGINSLELYCNGEKVPIEIFNSDEFFNTGDYFQFIGDKPKPTPFTNQNIYNLKNVYWLSFEGDSTFQYVEKDGYPNNNFDNTFRVTPHTLHYERDTLYEHLGYAPDVNRDFWYWGVASGQDGIFRKAFAEVFKSLKEFDIEDGKVTIRVNMHGLTTATHEANVLVTSQAIGKAIWTGQTEFTFEKTISIDSISFYPENNLQVVVYGGYNLQSSSDEIRINWFEIEYPRVNRAFGKKLSINSPPGNTGRNRYNVSYWFGNDISVYIPERGKVIRNADILNDQFNTVLFVDSIAQRTLYYCASSDYFNSPISIEKNINSDLRNTSNGADYIILTHPDFKVQADVLKEYRTNNLLGFPDSRVKIVNVFDVYKEFSFGLLNPEAIRDFIKYTFDNWAGSPPAYLAILGDMSWDYRELLSNSRENYIPSYPYHGTQFGLASSDNMFGAVVGDDVIADIAIGRISCETPEEAEVLVNKIINYPGDNSKYWKQNVLLIGAGESQNDEARFGFNDQCLLLDNNYIIPQGYTGEKIFAFPDSTNPEHQQFLGNTPEIRDAFSRGTVMANFYGHGGGYQWDAVFLNDDIALINNDSRLPFISSITCYTAHFENQEVFGEQFNSIPDRGSIGFWGHTGITFWAYGLDLNKRLYDEIYNKNNFVIGDAIRIAKSTVGSVNSKLVKDHVALLTLLGDPAIELALPKNPDFNVSSSEITINPSAPLTKDSVEVKVLIHNLGKVFIGDSVKIDIIDQVNDSTTIVASKYIYSFGLIDSVTVIWYPDVPGLHGLSVEVNSDGHIFEEDVSDNLATTQFTVFNLDNPNIISPINGSKWKNQTSFLFVDIGEFIEKDLSYFIEIDTTYSFENPIFRSVALKANNFGEVNYQSEILPDGYYFWRSRIKETDQYSNWSNTRTFVITDDNDEVSSTFEGKQLELFKKSNLVYSPENQALVLNLDPLHPKPINEHFIENIPIELPDDLQGLSAMTTDGTYFYVGHMAYYAISDPNFTTESKIYKYGTGYNGTVKGQLYGEVSQYVFQIWKQIFYLDGGVFIPTGDAFNLIRMDVLTGDTSSVYIPSGMIDERSLVQDGAFYLCSDGRYVYNLAYRDPLGNYKYSLRVLDPQNNWNVVGTDTILSGSSYPGFSSFFVASEFLYVFEKNDAGYMRSFPLDTYIFDDEWISFKPFAGYFAWSYDNVNDKVYSSVFVNGNESYTPNISVFKGTYNQAFGSAVSPEVGPVKQWKTLTHEIDALGSLGEYSIYLEGFNSELSKWDTINTNFGSNILLDTIDASIYNKMRTSFSFQDTTTAGSQPIKLKSLSFDFESMPELLMAKKYFSFEDSLLQGFPVKVKLGVKNVGYADIDSSDIIFYLNNDESTIYSTTVSIIKDSVVNLTFEINSDNLLFTNKLKAMANINEGEYYNFNNLIVDEFYVVRDSVKPEFQITFDGTEIISGDVVSANPNIFISLKDNSPLPIDTSNFSMYLNNNPLSFANDSLIYSYTAYPNSESQIIYKPNLINGKHFLDVYAKDASDNYFDTTSYRVSFVVDRENKVYDIYNYPNPFADDTYFTFTISGSELPEEMNVKIFTVAGRLIRDFEISVNQLGFGFNKIFWDGKDQDGNSIANGVYFCKFNILNNGEYLSKVKKIAKVK